MNGRRPVQQNALVDTELIVRGSTMSDYVDKLAISR
jgi:hypothetical protein